MRDPNGQLRHAVGDASAASIERLARYWTSATQAQRFEVVKAAINGAPDAPDFRTLQLAIYLAEVEAGEVAQG